MRGPPLRHEARPTGQSVVAGAEGGSRDCNAPGAAGKISATCRGGNGRIEYASIGSGDGCEEGDAVAQAGEEGADGGI